MKYVAKKIATVLNKPVKPGETIEMKEAAAKPYVDAGVLALAEPEKTVTKKGKTND